MTLKFSAIVDCNDGSIELFLFSCLKKSENLNRDVLRLLYF